jgi:hypothetical protein
MSPSKTEQRSGIPEEEKVPFPLVAIVVLLFLQIRCTVMKERRTRDLIDSIKEMLTETASSGISYQLRDRYTICMCVLLHVHNGNIEIISFVVKLLGVSQGMQKT